MNIADMYYVGPDYHKAFQIPVIEGNVFTPTLTDSLSQQVMVSRRFVERMKNTGRMDRLSHWEDGIYYRTRGSRNHCYCLWGV